MKNTEKKKTILIVDDEEHIVKMLDINVRNNGYRSLLAYSGEAALETVRTNTPDLILLDIMMPGMSGIEVCRRVKNDPETCRLPVIIVSAKSETQDRIVGLESGADDYVTKPFNLQELFLRIKAALRQVELLSEEKKTYYKLGSLELDTERFIAVSGGARIDLTLTEYRILQMLLQNAGKAVDRKVMLENIFERDSSDAGRTLDVHVRNLRKKMDSAQVRECEIRTVRGTGYIISESPEPLLQ